MGRKLVIDANSIINFFRYYCFDKYDSQDIHGKLKRFIVDKINNGEITIIDKVFNELREYDEIKDDIKEFKKQIESKVVNTTFLTERAEGLLDRYRVIENERRFYSDPNQLELELRKYLERYADIYLVSYCKYLNENNGKPVLITEESIRSDKKIVEKIPVICRKEHVEYQKIPYALFEIYKEELKFTLEVRIA